MAAMRIVHLVAGAGGMYCGSCLHGNALVAALRKAGTDALLLPMYTPLRTDDENHSLRGVAFGGVNVYLQQRWPLFRRTPWLFDRVLDRPVLLRWLARRGGTTRPDELGPLAVSMLRGEDGRQRKELEKLVRLLADRLRPDVVHLNNALLTGVAAAIRRRLGIPVVCSLTGEDAFLDKLPPPHREEAWRLLRQRAAGLDALIALSRYFATAMAGRLGVPPERIDVIPPGLDLNDGTAPAAEEPKRSEGEPFRLGFFSRVAPDKGLHLLAEAVGLLAKDASLPRLELHAAGYLDPADRPYLADVERRMAAAGVAARFHYHGAPGWKEKMQLLRSFDLFSLPTLLPESKGLPVLEAFAGGVPAVLPHHGVFVELIEDTGGGLLHEPGSAALLAEAIAAMMRDRALAAACGRRAQAAVRERYSGSTMATRTIELYRRTLHLRAEPSTGSVPTVAPPPRQAR